MTNINRNEQRLREASQFLRDGQEYLARELAKDITDGERFFIEETYQALENTTYALRGIFHTYKAEDKVYYREADGHTYYYKGDTLMGAPTNLDGTFDIDAEIPVHDFAEPLSALERAEIENALRA